MAASDPSKPDPASQVAMLLTAYFAEDRAANKKSMDAAHKRIRLLQRCLIAMAAAFGTQLAAGLLKHLFQ